MNQIWEPYRKAAEWLYEQKDIFEENVVLLLKNKLGNQQGKW